MAGNKQIYSDIFVLGGIGHQIAVYILEVVSSEQGSISQAGENHTGEVVSSLWFCQWKHTCDVDSALPPEYQVNDCTVAIIDIHYFIQVSAWMLYN